MTDATDNRVHEDDEARRLIDEWSKELREAINRTFAPLVRLAHDWEDDDE